VLVSGVICDSRNRPNDITAVPITGNILYRPVRLMSWPEEIDVRSMPPIIGSISRPDLVGDAPLATCRYTGMYVTDPNSAKPTMKPTVEVTVNARLRNNRSGNTGSFARCSMTTKATIAGDHRRDRARNETGRERRAPWICRTAKVGEQHDGAQRNREQRRTGVVDRVLEALHARRQRDREDRERQRAERQVDVEDPSPREVRREVAAEQRPRDARHAEHRAEDPLIPAALPRRHDVTDDRLRRDHETTAAEPLHRTIDDELRHVLARATER
jgi:hypothetical protein